MRGGTVHVRIPVRETPQFQFYFVITGVYNRERRKVGESWFLCQGVISSVAWNDKSK